MFLGIDIGPDAVTALLVDERDRPLARARADMQVERPRPAWSQVDPHSLWQATDRAVRELRSARPGDMGAVRGVGVAGGPHGVVLLDAEGRPVRPAILGDDGRSASECVELERRVPELRAVTGSIAAPGFAAPQLLWVARHEPDLFARTARVLAPKDFLRFLMTGAHATDPSEASGTLWFDGAGGHWSEALLAATGLEPIHVPPVFDGAAAAGVLRREIAEAWGLPADVPVAAGASRAGAVALAAGALRPGTGVLALECGVFLATTSSFTPDPTGAPHLFRHAATEGWMATLHVKAAARSVPWWAERAGGGMSILCAEARHVVPDTGPLFFPTLADSPGPWGNPDLPGRFAGPVEGTGRAALTRAVLDGAVYAFADALDGLRQAGMSPERVAVTGGRWVLGWAQELADALGLPVDIHDPDGVDPASGAARLGRIAATGEDARSVCHVPRPVLGAVPDARAHARAVRGLQAYRLAIMALGERGDGAEVESQPVFF